MTEINFYFNSKSISDVICKLCAKALNRQLNIFIQTEDKVVAKKLSKKLWQAKPIHFFLPNSISIDKNSNITPIIIGNNLNDHILKKEILINLCKKIPIFFSQYNKCIEIIDYDPETKKIGREHYSYFSSRGYRIETYNLSKNKDVQH